jgi:hypothetical protein
MVLDKHTPQLYDMIPDNYYIIYSKKYTKLSFYKNTVNFDSGDGVSLMIRDIVKKGHTEVNFLLHFHGGSHSHVIHLQRFIIDNPKICFSAYVPGYALSAGTAMAIMCNKIHCSKYAKFSPIDMQITLFDGTRSSLQIMNNSSSESSRKNKIISQLLSLCTHGDEELNKCLHKMYKIRELDINMELYQDILINNKAGHSATVIPCDLQKIGFSVDCDIPEQIDMLFETFIAAI